MPANVDPFKDGKDRLRKLVKEGERQKKVKVGDRMRKKEGTAGLTYAYDPQYIYVDGVITANNGGGSYNYTQIHATASGGWANDVPTGTCWERNANASVALGTYILLQFYPSSLDWRFSNSGC